MSGISPHQKKDPKKRQQGLKGKRGETSYKEAPCLKKEDEIYMLLGEILSKETKEGDHIFL
jgi:hypothetical protein